MIIKIMIIMIIIMIIMIIIIIIIMIIIMIIPMNLSQSVEKEWSIKRDTELLSTPSTSIINIYINIYNTNI